METIGIMAGSGQFPFLVARGARTLGWRVVMCAFHGFADPALEAEADDFIMLHLGRLGDLINFFKKHGATKVCMAGAISKPKAISDIKPDFRVTKLMLKLAGKAKGDDAILRAVAEELQSEGISILSPNTLVPGLNTHSGVLSARQPDADIWRDASFGWNIAKQVGAMDIGQCVVVRSGIVTAVECLEGTDAAISRGAELGGPGCMAVKVVKPGQDKRIDLPSVGAATIELLARHKFAGLAFEASGSLFFDKAKALELAKEHNICIIAVPAEADSFFAPHLT